MLCELFQIGIDWKTGSLNPCSNGRCSASSETGEVFSNHFISLNPCSNGRCSASDQWQAGDQRVIVLILVLMEDALRVLLTLMVVQPKHCLNPCSNGRVSASAVAIIRSTAQALS